jgi:anti-sigma B factor antagonist
MIHPFDCHLRFLAGKVLIDLSGDLQSSSESGLLDAFESALRQKTGEIVLNFNKVEYINSNGISLLVNLLIKAQKEKIRLSAFGLNDHYKSIFQITRLTDFIQLFPDENSVMDNQMSAFSLED